MREIHVDEVAKEVCRLIKRAEVCLPLDAAILFECMSEALPEGPARAGIADYLSDAQRRYFENLPLEGKTEIIRADIAIGDGVTVTGGTADNAVRTGADLAGYPSAAVVAHVSASRGETLRLRVSLLARDVADKFDVRLYHLSMPSAAAEDFIMNFAVNSADELGPPVVVAVCFGDDPDEAASCAQALVLEPMDGANTDPELAALEKRIRLFVNKHSGGPFHLGGGYGAMAVKARSLPRSGHRFACAVAVGSAFTRRAEGELRGI